MKGAAYVGYERQQNRQVDVPASCDVLDVKCNPQEEKGL